MNGLSPQTDSQCVEVPVMSVPTGPTEAIQGMSVTSMTGGTSDQAGWANWSYAGVVPNYPQRQQWSNAEPSYNGYQSSDASGFPGFDGTDCGYAVYQGMATVSGNMDFDCLRSQLVGNSGLDALFPGIEQYHGEGLDAEMDLSWTDDPSMASLTATHIQASNVDMSSTFGSTGPASVNYSSASNVQHEPALLQSATNLNSHDLCGNHPRLLKAAAFFPSKPLVPSVTLSSVAEPQPSQLTSGNPSTPASDDASPTQTSNTGCDLKASAAELRPVQYTPTHVTNANNQLLSQLSEILPSKSSLAVPRPPVDPSQTIARMPGPTMGPASSQGNAESVGIQNDKVPSPEGEGMRRSARGPVPTKRIEKMNEIGSNPPPPAPAADDLSLDKENDVPGAPPVWAVIAKEHLLLESELGFGKVGTKSSLPAANLRPEEWSKWTSKS
ncbi:hypothetical protein NLJ89_g11622 [Agrocybe chaxingu]|uniref:Uncharacterized protein n=1 Tax=Agrocybe chaxingu TaxID=84603 RepID=A0A9W8MP78_9AGAR|nr:hypothetical protein NLJ89_g11622 [Agrocybe chaxingu]